MASLSLKNICKVYPNGFEAVKNFNLEIADKEFIIFVGPSGCGKSTTLRMIAGLEDISSGELKIGDRVVNDVEPKDRDIAMVFQNYALYPHMTVYDNMAFGLKLRKVPKDEIDKRVREAARVLDIEHLLDRKPKALSGGQRQRVALGRAMVRNPAVFLLDEPLSNLDAKLRNQMRAEIIKLRQKINTTFLYVTHDQTEAMTLGDRIVIMKDGFIQQIGTPQEVFDHPANLFAADFIGTPQMNFFDAELQREGDRYENKQQRLAAKGVAGQHVTLGVRPQHISLQCESGSVKARMDVFEMMGSEIHLHANVNGRDMVIIVPTTDINGNYSDAFTIGKEIDFSFSGSTCHLFGNDGKNLEF